MKSRSFFARSLALSLALLLAGAVAAWTGPSSAPPNGNVAAPVNVSGTAQVKSGGFWASSVGSDSGYCIGASCITSWPSGGSGFTGSGSTNYLTKFIGATALGNSLIYDNGTNVGIGETAPGSKLSVSGGGSFGSGYDTTAAPTGGLIIEGNVGIGTESPGQKLDVNGTARLGSSASGGLLVVSTSGSSVNLRPSVGNGYITLTDDSGDVSRGMTIANGGNVGIGTESPGQKLDVNGYVKGTGLCIGTDCRTSWPSSGGAEADTIDSVLSRGNTTSRRPYFYDGVYATIFVDMSNQNYYIDPDNTSVLSDVRADTFYDRNDTSFYVNPAGTSMLSDVRADIFYDRNDTSFYVNPSGNSSVDKIYANDVYINGAGRWLSDSFFGGMYSYAEGGGNGLNPKANPFTGGYGYPSWAPVSVRAANFKNGDSVWMTIFYCIK